MVSHDQISHVTPHLVSWPKEYSSALMTPLASCDSKVSVSSITWPKNNATPNFSHLDIRNAIVPLMMPWASCNAVAHGITWPKKSCCTSFWISWPKECDGAINDVNTAVNGVTWLGSHAWLHFNHLDLRNTIVPLMMQWAFCNAGTSGITWPKK